MSKTAMDKTLLKYLLFEVLEKWVRVDRLLYEEALASETTPALFFDHLKTQLSEAQKHLFQEKAAFLELFSDKPAKNPTELTQLAQHIQQSYQTLSNLSQGLLAYLDGHPLPETNIFLKDVLSNLPDVLGDAAPKSQPAVHFHPEAQAPSRFLEGLNGAYLEPISLLHKHNPLGWVNLSQSLSRFIFDNRPEFNALQSKLSSSFSQASFYQPLACHVISLRLLGPAYFYAAVTEALLKQDTTFLNVLEPALFQAVHHFNFSDKSLIFLHEAAEKAQTVLGDNTDQKAPPSLSDHDEALGQLFRTIEKLLPEKAAFTDRQFEKAQQLQLRLAQDTLLSGANIYDEVAIREALEAKLTPEAISQGTVPIYELLSMVTETPNSPREILNAGWLHKLERSPAWLYNTINLSDEDGFSRLSDLVTRQDHLLVKSIETSEVHRVLLCGV